MFFDWLVTGQLLAFNPAAAVRGPKHVVKKGKTPVLTAEEARYLSTASTPCTLIGLRDRALIAVMVYSFARIGAVVGMKVEDYYQKASAAGFGCTKKAASSTKCPPITTPKTYLTNTSKRPGIAADRKAPLFRSAAGRTGTLTDQALRRNNALDMVKRRAKAVGPVRTDLQPHASGPPASPPTWKTAAPSRRPSRSPPTNRPKTTKLYDRTSDQITLDEVERIII